MINGDSKLYPEEYAVPSGNKTVILRSMTDLIARFGGYAARVDYRGEIELLVDVGEDTLVWAPLTDLDVPDAQTKN